MTDIDARGPRGREDGEVLDLMRRVAVAMFLLGGVTCASGYWITQSTPESARIQLGIAGVFVATGLVVAISRPGRRALDVSAMWAVALISALIATGDPIGMAPFFFLWPLVFTAYFSATRVVVTAYALMVVTMAVALVLNDAIDMKLDTFAGTASTVGLMTALIATMTRQESRLRRELAEAAETDPLTGLLNRRSFNPLAALRVADTWERQRPLSVVMFDLDHFKRLNDERGHLEGDRALVRVADVLTAHSRDEDLVARFGGEEFAVVLAGATAEAARAYAERVAAGIGVAAIGAGGAVLSVSAGICTMTDLRMGAEQMLSHADDALYAAKHGGRGRSATWTPGGVEVGEPFASEEPPADGQAKSERSTPTS